MNDNRNGFIVYADDLKPILDELSDAETAALFRAMVNYQIDGADPGFTGLLKVVFIPIKNNMDRNTKKYVEKCERNRQNAAKRWNSDSMRTDATACDGMQSDAMDANINKYNINKYKEKKRKEKKSNADESAAASIPDAGTVSLLAIAHLNEVTGRRYQADNKTNAELIAELMRRGYQLEDIISVIDRKAAEWGDSDKMRPYLRPSTLFNPERFDEYLNAPETREERTQTEAAERKANAERDLERLNVKYEELRNQYAAEPDIKRRIDIKGNLAVIEAQIEAARAAIY